MSSGENSSNGVIRPIWSLVRQNPLLSSMVAIAVMGLGISIYLTTIHYTHTAPVCTVTGIINCSNVLKSSYSVIPGTSIPITIPGMLWFGVSGALAVVALISTWRNQPEPERLPLFQLLWASVGLLFVLYLIYDEVVQLHNICEWCTGVHILTLLTFILAWYRFASPVSERSGTAKESHQPAHQVRRPRTGNAHGYALPRSARARGVAGHAPVKTRSHRS